MKTKKTKDKVQKYARTISEALLQEWQNNIRMGDTKEITIQSGLTKPTIEKALKYGNVNQPHLVDFITNYFKERLQAEDAAAKELEALRTKK